MPRPRVHNSDAERQAAYRMREATLPANGLAVHQAMQEAAEKGLIVTLDTEQIVGDTPERTLKNVFEAIRAVIDGYHSAGGA